MAWPTHGKVRCIKFDKRYLPTLRHAIDGKMVRWGNTSGFAESFLAEFTWDGCLWELSEFCEIVESIKLIEGKLKEEDLTAAILKG
jgi:hypothetical protein